MNGIQPSDSAHTRKPIGFLLGISTAVPALVLCASALGGLQSCKYAVKSNPRALESKDWFRNGVDRFYLAVAPQGVLMEGTVTGARVGQEMLYGIGCFGEAKDRAAPVQLPVTAADCNGLPKTMPLNERYKVDQFPMAPDPARPKKGECIIIMGDSDALAHMQLFPKDYQTGPGSEAIKSFFMSAGVCGVTLALMHGPTRAKVGTVFKGAMTRAGTAVQGVPFMSRVFQAPPSALVAAQAAQQAAQAAQMAQVATRATTVGSSAAKMQLALLAGGHVSPVMRVGIAAGQVGTATAAFTGSFARWLTGNRIVQAAGTVFGPVASVANKALNAFPCIETASSLWGLVGAGQKNANRTAFFRGMADAERLTAEFMQRAPAGETFRKLMAAGNAREAAALYNPVFAKIFNKNVYGTFEQGWSVLNQNPQNFFDTVRDIQAEIAAVGKQVENGQDQPQTAFGATTASAR